MVAYEGQYGKLRRRVLIVNYTDFGVLLDQVDREIERLEPRHHIRAVLRSALKAIVEHVPSERWVSLSENDQQLLGSYAQEFADPVSQFRISAVIKEQGADLPWNRMSPLEILEVFAALVVQMERESIYVLVDRIDEVAETSRDPDAAIALLRPLVAEQSLLEMKNVAFKFFLPSEVGERLRESVMIRADRVLWHTVTWDRESLKTMVQTRLRHYSEDRVPGLEDLCVPEVRYTIMDRLINASEGSPRTLLRLCNELVHHHVATSDDLLIGSSDITSTLYDFGRQLQQERDGRRLMVTREPVHIESATLPPAEGLYLDDHGHVWVDGVELVEQPSLLEIRLLETLYHRAGDIVANEDLIKAVWGPLGEDQDETNLRKLISRLRKKLRPGSFGGEPRFVNNARGRGYWLKR